MSAIIVLRVLYCFDGGATRRLAISRLRRSRKSLAAPPPRKHIPSYQSSRQLHRLRTLGSFSIDDGDGEGSKNVTLKSLLRSYLGRSKETLLAGYVYSNPLKISNERRISLELISWGLHSSLERERKIRRRLFTSSISREITHFHVVVVQ